MKTLALREKDVSALRQIFRRFAFVKEVRVFGSRATNEARRASDLDLAISAPEAAPREWSELCEALENAPVIYELDLVRRETSTNNRLLGKVESEGIRIYPE